MQYPEFIKRKETIGICAPSAGVGKKLEVYRTSIKRLQQDFTIIETKSVRNNDLRSNDAMTRAKELEELYLNENVKLILCASGGNFLSIMPILDIPIQK